MALTASALIWLLCVNDLVWALSRFSRLFDRQAGIDRNAHHQRTAMGQNCPVAR
jgi:hypothetical protein